MQLQCVKTIYIDKRKNKNRETKEVTFSDPLCKNMKLMSKISNKDKYRIAIRFILWHRIDSWCKYNVQLQLWVQPYFTLRRRRKDSQCNSFLRCSEIKKHFLARLVQFSDKDGSKVFRKSGWYKFEDAQGIILT